ncbi:MAG: hypothetical protein AB7O59_17445 [Pirellulales bacterium]
MKRSNAYLLYAISLTVALAASPALAGSKKGFSLNRSSMSQSSVSRSLAPRVSTGNNLIKSNQINSMKLNTGALSGRTLSARQLNSNVKNLGQFNTSTQTGVPTNGLTRSKIGKFDPSKFTPVVNGTTGNVGTGRGGSLGPIFDAGKPLVTTPIIDKLGPIVGGRRGGVFDPGQVFNPDKPILDPGIGGGRGPLVDVGGIGDPGNPPVLDPGAGNGGPNPSPDDPVGPGAGGGNPPADPQQPPCPPNNPPCPPHCDPPYCGGGNWGFPFPFPVPYPVGGGGGYYGGCTTVVDNYVPVTTVAAGIPAVGQTVQPIDLEVLEVRQLDRGDSAKQLGAAYRVWLRNKSGVAVTTSFNVGLIASIGRVPSTDSTFVMQRAEKIDAGQTLAVDIRLPAKAYSMAQNADGQPVGFAFLTAVVDTHSEVEQADRQNDVTTLNRGDIAMVAQQ